MRLICRGMISRGHVGGLPGAGRVIKAAPVPGAKGRPLAWRMCPEECAQGIVELALGFQVGQVAGALDHEDLGVLEAGDDLGGHRVVRPWVF